ncbi:MAG: hypothetical protein ABI037_02690 [Gemmatimonadales bacterium]
MAIVALNLKRNHIGKVDCKSVVYGHIFPLSGVIQPLFVAFRAYPVVRARHYMMEPPTQRRHPVVYLVSYDLRAPGQKYEVLDKPIAALGGKRVLLSQWVLVSAKNAAQIWTHLNQYVDANDALLVTEITKSTVWSSTRLRITDAQMEAFRVQARG